MLKVPELTNGIDQSFYVIFYNCAYASKALDCSQKYIIRFIKIIRPRLMRLDRVVSGRLNSRHHLFFCDQMINPLQ